MTERLVPEQFAEIARLSDEARAKHRQAVTANSNPELTRQVLAVAEAEYMSLQPRPLFTYMATMSDESFKELMGWVLFGRDYTPRDGNPFEVLERYIRDATIYPRDVQEIYLEQKPIGKYLRKAMEHILTTTSRDIERAEDDDYETGEEGEEGESD
jgi:hypothetical protein